MEWRCTNCGTTHQRNTPPCHECGGMDFERVVVRLEWECDDCGELVETPDEPCPNCGESAFSRLSDPDAGPDPLDNEVRVTPASEHQQQQQHSSNIVWECENCGTHHMRNSPPCNRCGGTQFTKLPFETTVEDGPQDRSWLFDRTSSVLSIAGLALAVLGGLVVMYGGFLFLGSPTYQTTGNIPDSAWRTILIGVAVVALGAGVVLFDTRHRDISF